MHAYVAIAHQLSLEVLDTLVHHRNPPKPTKSWRPSSVSLKPDIPRAPVPMPSPAAAAAGCFSLSEPSPLLCKVVGLTLECA